MDNENHRPTNINPQLLKQAEDELMMEFEKQSKEFMARITETQQIGEEQNQLLLQADEFKRSGMYQFHDVGELVRGAIPERVQNQLVLYQGCAQQLGANSVVDVHNGANALMFADMVANQEELRLRTGRMLYKMMETQQKSNTLLEQMFKRSQEELKAQRGNQEYHRGVVSNIGTAVIELQSLQNDQRQELVKLEQQLATPILAGNDDSNRRVQTLEGEMGAIAAKVNSLIKEREKDKKDLIKAKTTAENAYKSLEIMKKEYSALADSVTAMTAKVEEALATSRNLQTDLASHKQELELSTIYNSKEVSKTISSNLISERNKPLLNDIEAKRIEQSLKEVSERMDKKLREIRDKEIAQATHYSKMESLQIKLQNQNDTIQTTLEKLKRELGQAEDVASKLDDKVDEAQRKHLQIQNDTLDTEKTFKEFITRERESLNRAAKEAQKTLTDAGMARKKDQEKLEGLFKDAREETKTYHEKMKAIWKDVEELAKELREKNDDNPVKSRRVRDVLDEITKTQNELQLLKKLDLERIKQDSTDVREIKNGYKQEMEQMKRQIRDLNRAEKYTGFQMSEGEMKKKIAQAVKENMEKPSRNPGSNPWNPPPPRARVQQDEKKSETKPEGPKQDEGKRPPWHTQGNKTGNNKSASNNKQGNNNDYYYNNDNYYRTPQKTNRHEAAQERRRLWRTTDTGNKFVDCLRRVARSLEDELGFHHSRAQEARAQLYKERGKWERRRAQERLRENKNK